MSPRRTACALGALAITALLVVLPGPAVAHSALVSSTPSEGARLEQFPDEVQLVFTQEVSPPAYVIVTGPDGRSLGIGDVETAGATVTLATEPSKAAGSYSVAFRVVSTDGHPISGQITATVGDGTSDAVPSPENQSTGSTERADGTTAAAGPQPGSAPATTSWSRNGVAVTVGVTLFALAIALALLARRYPPYDDTESTDSRSAGNQSQ